MSRRPLSISDTPAVPATPIGGGECGALIRAHDWAATPLGPIADWPAALRVTVQGLLDSPVPQILAWGADHRVLYNDAFIAIAKLRHPAAMGGAIAAVWPEQWDWNREVMARGLAGEVLTYRGQPLVLRRDGGKRTLTLDLFYVPVRGDDGAVAGVVCTAIDQSARAAAERDLARSAAELRSVTAALPVLIAYIDRDFIYRFANEHYRVWMGVAPEDMIGRPVEGVLGAALFAERKPGMDRALAGERIVEESRVPNATGADRRAEIHYIPRIEADGAIPGFHVLVFDVEERAEREDALDRSNGRFRAAMAAVHGVLWTNSADGRMLGEQPGWAALTGQAFDEYQGYGWADAVHPDDVAASVAAWQAAVAAVEPFVFEHRVRRHDGIWRTFAIRSIPTISAGTILEWVGVHTDITDQREAEEALRRQIRHRERAEGQLRVLNDTLETRIAGEIAERRQAEAALAQAQKMETIGQLTGGVAHDFNNLLQVVSGNLQLLTREVAGNARAERRVANAMAGVERGAKLAAQLLAFGRRQALEPRVVNVARFVHGMEDILRRAVGEGVVVDTVITDGLWNTFIDPAQVENALLNLAINARDGMAGKGRLTIEVVNKRLAAANDVMPAGDYIRVSVRDTGSGMTPAVMARAFEPFFSTKSEGKGSGLGLSMVYGFVKQSGGHVRIESTPGEGTTVHLVLPRAEGPEDVERPADDRPVTGGDEAILVVEDDDAVRTTVVGMLEDLGYRVTVACDPDAGLAILEAGTIPDLIFTDVVMPGSIDSAEMARRARLLLPHVAVLFTSGYAESAIVHGGRLVPGVELLAKPYSREALARRVRQMLDAVPRSRVVALLVEDDALIRSAVGDVLAEAGFEVVAAASAEQAMTLSDALSDAKGGGVLVTDVNLPGASGIDLAGRIRAQRSDLGVVFATGDSSKSLPPEDARTVVLRKPYGAGQLVAAVRRVIDARR